MGIVKLLTISVNWVEIRQNMVDILCKSPGIAREHFTLGWIRFGLCRFCLFEAGGELCLDLRRLFGGGLCLLRKVRTQQGSYAAQSRHVMELDDLGGRT